MMLSGFKTYRIVAGLLMVSLLAFANCKPADEPFNSIEEPVFSIKGTVNGEKVQMVAGVDSYYMFTSYTYDAANQAFSFSGAMKRTGCDSCDESIQIILYDKTNNNGTTPVNIASALPAGGYQYYFSQVTQKIRYKYQFKSEIKYYLAPSFYWTFGTTDSSALPNPVVYFSDTNARNVCLKVTDNINQCTKTHCNNITPPKVVTTDYIKPDFAYDTLISLDTIQFYNLCNSPGGASYLWDFGDGNQTADSAPRHFYSAPGRYKVSLTMTSFGPYGSQKIEKYVSFKNPTTDCLVNYSYDKPVPDTLTTAAAILSKIIIRYVDAGGEVFLSSTQAQPITSFFEIISAAPYQNNEKGEKTRSLTLRIRCRVYSTTTASFKDIDIPSAQIAVAYP